MPYSLGLGAECQRIWGVLGAKSWTCDHYLKISYIFIMLLFTVFFFPYSKGIQLSVGIWWTNLLCLHLPPLNENPLMSSCFEESFWPFTVTCLQQYAQFFSFSFIFIFLYLCIDATVMLHFMMFWDINHVLYHLFAFFNLGTTMAFISLLCCNNWMLLCLIS